MPFLFYWSPTTFLNSGLSILTDQLSQLRELVAETVGSQCSGSGEASGLLADVPLLSPASPLNIEATTTTEQNLNGVNLPNVIQDGSLSLRQLVPSLPQASQGPAQQIVTNQAYEHDLTLPLLLEKLRSKTSKRRHYPCLCTFPAQETPHQWPFLLARSLECPLALHHINLPISRPRPPRIPGPDLQV